MGGCSAAFDKEVTVLLLPYPAPGFVLKTRKLYPSQGQIGQSGAEKSINFRQKFSTCLSV